MTSGRAEPRFWEHLLTLIEEAQVIPVVGQDLLTVSSGARDVPLYAYLAERVALELDVDADDLPVGDELNTVARRYMAGRGRPDIQDLYLTLKSVMPGPEALPVPAALTKLAEILPFKLFISTTFDSLLARAIDEVRFVAAPGTTVLAYSPHSIEDLPSELKRLDSPVVYHLLGKLSVVPDYVVTDEDMLEFMHALQSKTRQPGLLFDELVRQQLLMIGNRFPDWLARFFLRTTAGEPLSSARGRSFVADRVVREDDRLRTFLEQFSGRTRVFGGGGALEFVDELHERWMARAPDGAPVVPDTAAETLARPSTTRGSIFLSYASEDQAVAERIRGILEAARLDVWLDKERLAGGDEYESFIRSCIESSSLFLPLISRHTLASPERRFYRLEWKHAQRVAQEVAESERFIVPVAIDETSPDEEGIPAAFRRLHWERHPDGQLSRDFVDDLTGRFRRYQEMLAGAS